MQIGDLAEDSQIPTILLPCGNATDLAALAPVPVKAADPARHVEFEFLKDADLIFEKVPLRETENAEDEYLLERDKTEEL